MRFSAETDPPHLSGLLLRILRGAGGALMLRVSSTAVIFITRILIARQLGISEFGIFSYALAWLELLAVIALLGTDRMLVRDLSIYLTQHAWEHAKGLMRFSIAAVLILSGGICLIALVVLWLSTNYTNERLTMSFLGTGHLVLSTTQWVYAIGLAIISLPVVVIIRICGSNLQALQHIIRSQIPEFGLRPILFLALLIVISVGKTHLTAWTVILIYGFALLAAAIYSSYLLIRLRPGNFKNVRASYEIRKWLAAMLPLALLQIAYFANGRIAIIMLGLLANSTDAGIFSVAERIIVLVALALYSANHALAPYFARLFRRGDWQQLQVISTWGARGAFFITSLLGILLITFSGEILDLFGIELVSAHLVLIILIIGQIINAFCGSVTVLLISTYHEVATTRAVLISAVLNIAANVLLIPIYGAIGAALASTISLIYWNAHLVIFARQRLGIDTTALGIFSKQPKVRL